MESILRFIYLAYPLAIPDRAIKINQLHFDHICKKVY